MEARRAGEASARVASKAAAPCNILVFALFLLSCYFCVKTYSPSKKMSL